MAEGSALEDMSVGDDSGFFEDDSSLTHPRCYNSDHVEELKTFAEDLDLALKTSFPSGPNPYTSVHVLLLRWTDDDLGVQVEISALRRAFETRFHFDVEEWQIPSLNPTRALQKKLYGFQEVHQSETELLIVYYGGHAKADPRRGRSIWQAHSQANSPFLSWSSLQPLLETAVPHVLIILDCCFAATAARDTTEGTTKEILAACGRESPTLGVGQRSFTSALIEEMQAFDGAPFTAAMLHARLVTMRWRLAFTPIYALLSERGGSSVTICPFVDGRASFRVEPNFPAELEVPEHPQDGQASLTTDDSPSFPAPLEQTVDTRVLLSVSVVQDAIHDVSYWVSWLTTAAPWDVTKVDVQVHSIFKSHSTLVVISIPTSAWDRLPGRPAYRFIGFVRSGDILQAAESLMKPLSYVREPEAVLYPTNVKSDLQSNPRAQSTNQRHKLQRPGSIPQPTAKVQVSHPAWFPTSEVTTSHSTAAPRSPQSLVHSYQRLPEWSPEDDEILMRAHRLGLHWQSNASQYFPDKTDNAPRKP